MRVRNATASPPSIYDAERYGFWWPAKGKLNGMSVVRACDRDGYKTIIVHRGRTSIQLSVSESGAGVHIHVNDEEWLPKREDASPERGR